jgi:flagellar motor switch protein FliN/FliY
MSVTATAEWLVAQWSSRFGEITLTMGDLQPEMHVAPIEDPTADGGLLWWEQPFSCAPDSPIWIGAPQHTCMEIGNIVLAATGVEPAPAAEIQSTYFEIVRQSMASLASDIGHRTCTDVTASNGIESAPRKISRHCFKIEAKLPEKILEFYLIIGEELYQVIAAAAAPGMSPALQHSLEQPGAPASRTFELLLDVELPVTVSFGRTAVRLQDAIKLTTGSLIELDRGLSDPVELLVNNCIIARGEVVVIEGNYGVRITEIVSQKERLQQSRRYMMQ